MVRHLHRRQAVGVVARAGDQSVGDLELHHDDEADDGRHVIEQVADQGHRHVVREVRHQRPRPGAQQRLPVDPHSVGVDDAQGPVVAGHLLEHVDEHVVDLDGRDLGARLEQRQGQRTQARAHLDHAVAEPDPCQFGDAADRVGLDDEVLAQRALGPDPKAVEESSSLGPGERHTADTTGASGWTSPGRGYGRYRPHTGHWPRPRRS